VAARELAAVREESFLRYIVGDVAEFIERIIVGS
jgi:hypothetical protein